jgi:drug/metabolite transporter (DMT)-like permease
MAPLNTSETTPAVDKPELRQASAPNSLLALLALVVGAAAIGVGPILVRLSEVGPCATAWWRMALALPLFAVWMLAERLAHRRRGSAKPPTARSGLLLAGVFFAIDLSLFHWGIVLTTVTNSTLLSNLAPIFVTFGAWWLFGERVSWGARAALVVALSGAALLVLGKSERDTFRQGAHPLLGDSVSFIAAFAYAAYQLTVTRVRRQASTAEFMCWSCLACAGLVGLVALLSGERLLPVSARGWWILLALALIAQVIGQGLITWALKHLAQAFSTVALLVQPVVAAAIAWPLFGEVLTVSQCAGAGILLLGICWSRLSTSRTTSRTTSCSPSPAAKHPDVL